MSTLDAVKNFAKATVSTGYAAGIISIVVSAGEGAKFPDPSADGEFNLVWWNSTDYADPSDDTSVEIVRCTARSTDTFTITRAQESTADVDHNIGGKTYNIILALTAKMIDDIGNKADNEIPAGDIDGSNVTFTLANSPSPADSLKVFLNGAFQTAGGEDYTLVDDTMTFVFAPESGEVLRAFYTY